MTREEMDKKTTVVELTLRIDAELLRQQQCWLIEQRDDLAEGLVNLIDAIIDEIDPI